MSMERLRHADIEDCSKKELAALAKANRIFLKACYVGACADFRANVFQLLQEYKALRNGLGWAIFNVCQEDEAGAVDTIRDQKEILIYSFAKPGAQTVEGNPISTIRIFTNELVQAPARPEFIAYDFTLDDEDDAQYRLNSTFFGDGEDLESTRAPIFLVDKDGRLQMNHVPLDFTEVDIVEDQINGQVIKVVPFGAFTRLEDKIHALSIGKDLVDEVIGLEPAYVCPSWA